MKTQTNSISIKNLTLVLALIPFCLFGTPKAKENSKLSGDWIRIVDKYEMSTFYIGLRFENDTLFNITNLGLEKIGRYYLRRDSILVENYEKKISGYVIENQTSDSLTISGSGIKIKYYARYLEFDPALSLNSIYMEAGSSSDEYPQFKLWVDKNGNAKFKGAKNCKMNGKKKFILPSNRTHKIDSTFKWSNIESLDAKQFYGVTNDWSVKFRIEYNEHKSKVITGTSSRMPFRLKGIVWSLFYELKKKQLI